MEHRPPTDAPDGGGEREPRRPATLLGRLEALATALADASSAADVAGASARACTLALDGGAAVVFVADEADALRMLGVHGVERERLAGYERVSIHRDLPACAAFRTGRPVWLEAYGPSIEGSAERRETARAFAVEAAFAVPLETRGRRIGVLVASFAATRTFSQEERDFVLTLGRACAQALDRARLLDEERAAREAAERAAAYLTVLAETSRAFAEATLDVDRLLETTARLASASLSAGCVVRLASPDGAALDVAALHHPDADALARARPLVREAWLDPAEGVAGEAMRTGAPRLIDDVEATVLPSLPARMRALCDAFAAHCALFVPLRARGRSLGLVTLVRGRGLPPFVADDLRFARDLCDRAALALDNARLYRAADGAARAREEVLAVVAHDLRNPLGVITLCARLLPRRAPFDAAGDEIRATAERIRRAAGRIEELVESVLDATKIERGKLVVAPTRVAAGSLVREAVELLTVVARERGLALEIEPGDAADAPVLADAARVTQVFSNLIGNALRFTRPGGRIVVRASADGGGGAEAHVRFDVEDDGVGIAPDHLPRVFERFFRAESRERAGAGLGLFIAQGIVEAHGGSISIASTLGRGTTVSFTLPRAPA